jgi:hypothetical protein
MATCKQAARRNRDNQFASPVLLTGFSNRRLIVDDLQKKGFA